MLNIAPGALTAEQAAYLNDMHTDIRVLLPRISESIFKGRSLTKNEKSAKNTVASVNVGKVVFSEKLQRAQETRYNSLYYAQRWAGLREWTSNYLITKRDDLSGLKTYMQDLMAGLPAAATELANQVGVSALLGTAKVGDDVISAKDVALPDKNVISWDPETEDFTDVLENVKQSFSDAKVSLNAKRKAFVLADGFVQKALANSPKYISILNMNSKMLPEGEMGPYLSINPLDYPALPTRQDTDGKTVYRIPVWVTDAITEVVWLDPLISVLPDASHEHDTSVHFGVYRNAVRNYEEGVRVIEFKRG